MNQLIQLPPINYSVRPNFYNRNNDLNMYRMAANGQATRPAFTHSFFIPSQIISKSPSSELKEEQGNISSARLSHKLIGDVLVAAGVTFAVAPFLTVVDKAIVQNAAGSHSLVQSGMQSIQGIVRNPIAYFKSPTFLLMWGVYAATYSTANCLKTVAEHREQKQVATSTSKASLDSGKWTVFFGTTAVNSGASLLKDKAYARMFGVNSAQNVMPRMTYALWMARDLSVVGSSFILPDLVSARLVEMYDMDQKSAKSMCQLVLPVATQFVAGPLHFMGLDLYNRNLDSKSWRSAIVDRTMSLQRGFVPVVAARIARIAPGYGIGGVFNTRFRDSWREYLVKHGESSSMSDERKNRLSSYLAAFLLYGGMTTRMYM